LLYDPNPILAKYSALQSKHKTGKNLLLNNLNTVKKFALQSKYRQKLSFIIQISSKKFALQNWQKFTAIQSKCRQKLPLSFTIAFHPNSFLKQIISSHLK